MTEPLQPALLPALLPPARPALPPAPASITHRERQALLEGEGGGITTAANIPKTCGDQQMKPVCDFKAYNDAHCLHATSYRHYSHPSHECPSCKGLSPCRWYY